MLDLPVETVPELSESIPNNSKVGKKRLVIYHPDIKNIFVSD